MKCIFKGDVRWHVLVVQTKMRSSHYVLLPLQGDIKAQGDRICCLLHCCGQHESPTALKPMHTEGQKQYT